MVSHWFNEHRVWPTLCCIKTVIKTTVKAVHKHQNCCQNSPQTSKPVSKPCEFFWLEIKDSCAFSHVPVGPLAGGWDLIQSQQWHWQMNLFTHEKKKILDRLLATIWWQSYQRGYNASKQSTDLLLITIAMLLPALWEYIIVWFVVFCGYSQDRLRFAFAAWQIEESRVNSRQAPLTSLEDPHVHDLSTKLPVSWNKEEFMYSSTNRTG